MSSEEDEEVYTEEEANEAVSFIQEHELPMSDLHYALRYVRILHKGHDELQDSPKKEPQVEVAMVEPPEFDSDCLENDCELRDLL